MTLCRVTCPDCLGASCDPAEPPCGWCMSQGHLDTDRDPDGTIPCRWPDGRPMIPWVDESEALFARVSRAV